ncbi:MAG: helix-turn-helix transcriptional regulator, partial [Flavobacterium sp.]
MEFRDKVKVLRQKNNLTLEEVAKQVGVSAPTIQRYESGEIKNLRRDKIESLANALKCSPGYLMGWKKDSLEEEIHDFQLTYLEKQIIEKYRVSDYFDQTTVLRALKIENSEKS